jgi:hypothetical protein
MHTVFMHVLKFVKNWQFISRKVTSAVLTRALLDEAVPLPYIRELIATAIDSSLCDPATLNEVEQYFSFLKFL